MKISIRGLFLGLRIAIAIWMGVWGYDHVMIVLGTAWIFVAPRISQRCLWFSPDVLRLWEECLAMLLVAGVVVCTGIVWLSLLGYGFSFVSLLVWTIGVVVCGLVTEYIYVLRK